MIQGYVHTFIHVLYVCINKIRFIYIMYIHFLKDLKEINQSIKISYLCIPDLYVTFYFLFYICLYFLIFL